MQSLFSLYHKNTKNIILSSLSDLTLVSDREGIENPFIALVARIYLFVLVRGTRAWPPTGLIPWFSKNEGNTYATLLHHPSLFKGKPTHAQEVARRIFGAVAREAYTKSSQDLISRQRAISGIVAGEIYAQVKTYQVPITNSSPSHYIICHWPLVFQIGRAHV